MPSTADKIEPNKNNTKRFIHNLLPLDILQVSIHVIITDMPLR